MHTELRQKLLDDRKRLPGYAQIYLGSRLVGNPAQIPEKREIQLKGKQVYLTVLRACLKNHSCHLHALEHAKNSPLQPAAPGRHTA